MLTKVELVPLSEHPAVFVDALLAAVAQRSEALGKVGTGVAAGGLQGDGRTVAVAEEHLHQQKVMSATQNRRLF